MAMKVFEIISNSELIGKKQIDLKDMPLGDVFRDHSLSKVSYDFMQKNNNFYSSEYLSRMTDYLKQSQAKL